MYLFSSHTDFLKPQYYQVFFIILALVFARMTIGSLSFVVKYVDVHERFGKDSCRTPGLISVSDDKVSPSRT